MPKSRRGPGRIEDALTVMLDPGTATAGVGRHRTGAVEGPGQRVRRHPGQAGAAVHYRRGQGAVKTTSPVGMPWQIAVKRLENGHCTAAVAGCVIRGGKHQQFQDAVLDYAILDIDNQEPDWLSGIPQEFGNAIKLAPAQLGNADLAASQLRGELDKVLPRLSTPAKARLGPRPGPAYYPNAQEETGRGRRTICQVGSRVGNRQVRHRRHPGLLGHRQRDDVSLPARPVSRGGTPPGVRRQGGRAGPVHGGLAAQPIKPVQRRHGHRRRPGPAWDTILALDYKPVFQTAIAGLKAPNDDKDWRDSLKIIADAAGNLTANLAADGRT